MTIARKERVCLDATPYYHCISRCVRRAYLCGTDRESGKNYAHRKQWIVDRIKHLSTIMAIDICAYAVMSNHYHIVLHVDRTRALSWTDAEVVSRWNLLFSKGLGEKQEHTTSALDIATWRERLMSISWFMRCINEPIARISNREDHCKGRFWEGRFKSQALLDDGALLACMSYVDLNPIRAGVAQQLQDSAFTSIEERIHQHWAKIEQKSKQVRQYQARQYHSLGTGLLEFASSHPAHRSQVRLPITRSEYFDLLDWTCRNFRDSPQEKMPAECYVVLERLKLNASTWFQSVRQYRSMFYQIVGAAQLLESNASQFKRHWVKGQRSARQMYQSP